MNNDSKLPKENFQSAKVKKEIKKEDDSDSDESTSSLVSLLSNESSSSKSDVCPICLCSFKQQISARPEVCEHKFCFECLQEWSKKTNTCPIDRKTFFSIRVNDTGNRVIKIENRQNNLEAELFGDDVTYCEICNRSDREDRMLLCDGCDRGFHCECLTPRLNNIPEGEWLCTECQPVTHRNSNRATTSSVSLRQTVTIMRPFVRTRFSERIRHTINENRIQRGVYIIISESETDTDDDESDDYDDEDDDEEDINENISENELNDLERDTNSIDDSITSAIQRALNTPLNPIINRKQTKKPTRKRKRRRTFKRTAKKTNQSKIKRRKTTRRRRRRRYRRVASKTSVSVQDKILNSIYKANLKKFDDLISTSRDTLSLNSIELDVMADKDKRDKFKSFPKPNQPWYQTNSYLNEIDESDPNIPLSSMSLNRPADSSIIPKRTNSQASLDVLDSILNSQKVLHTSSSKVCVNRDGSLGLVEKKFSTDKSKNQKNLNKPCTSEQIRMDDSNVLLTNAPYDPFNPDDDESEKSKEANENLKTESSTDSKQETKQRDIKSTIIIKRPRSKSPTKTSKEHNRTRSRSKSPKTNSNDSNKSSKQIKREHSRSKSSSSRDEQRYSSSRNDSYKQRHSHHHHHHHHRSSYSRRSRSRTRSRSNSRHRKYSRDHQQHHSRSTHSNSSKKTKDEIKNPSDNSKKDQVLVAKIKRSPKYTESLFEEMISQETQQTIDINSIKLPISNENKQIKLTNGEIIKKEPFSNDAEGTKSLDKRLNQLFGTTSETNSRMTEKETKSTLNDMVKTKTDTSNVKNECLSPKEEPYDLEFEYQNETNNSKLTDNTDKKQDGIHEAKINETQSKKLLTSQEKIVNAAKLAIKPFYVSKKISKDDYKLIMKKVVTKSLEQNKKGTIIDEDKVSKMIQAYAKKFQSQNKQQQQQQSNQQKIKDSSASSVLSSYHAKTSAVS